MNLLGWFLAGRLAARRRGDVDELRARRASRRASRHGERVTNWLVALTLMGGLTLASVVNEAGWPRAVVVVIAAAAAVAAAVVLLTQYRE